MGALFWKQRCLIEMLAQPITDGPHETPNLVKRGIPFISDSISQEKEVLYHQNTMISVTRSINLSYMTFI